MRLAPSTARRVGMRRHGATGLTAEAGYLYVGTGFQRDRIRVVHDAIEDRVGDRRLAQIRVPLIAGQLAGDDRRAGSDRDPP
jgi:hypothetical protein